MDKVKTTLKQIMRDWSSEGELERDSCYTPVLKELNQLYSVDER